MVLVEKHSHDLINVYFLSNLLIAMASTTMGDVSEKICTINLIIEVDSFIGWIQYVWIGREGVKNYDGNTWIFPEKK